MPKNHRHIWISFALFLLTAGIFLQTLGHGFITFDDPLYVTNNPLVIAGLSLETIREAFTTDRGGFWFPLTWLSLALDSSLFGLKAWGFHATNILLHAANTILLFLVLRRMTGAVWPAAFVAAGFAVHPLHVESVAWVTERKDVLYGLFWMLGLLAYQHYTKKTSLARYALLAGALACGLASKPMMVTFPFVLLLLDVWPLRRIRFSGGKADVIQASRLAGEKIPLFLMVLAASWITMSIQSMHVLHTAQRWDPASANLANAFVSYWKYLGMTVWPSGLSIFYPHPGHLLPLWQPLTGFFALAAVSGMAILSIRTKPYFFVGWFWFLGTLVPAIGIVQSGGQGMADRFTYIPLAGILMAAAFAGHEIALSWPGARRAVRTLSVSIIFLWSVLAFLQAGLWKTPYTLFSHALNVTENNFVAHNHIGMLLARSGNREKAIEHFRQSISIRSRADAHCNLALALEQEGDIENAILHYRKAVVLEPWVARYNDYLGMALADSGDIKGAKKAWQRAILAEPGHIPARCHLANALAIEGRFIESVKEYSRALELSPRNEKTLDGLVRVFYAMGKMEQAIRHCRTLVQVAPENAEYRANLAFLMGNAR